MKKNVICTALLLSVFSVTGGCANKQDANEENFGAAISQYLDKKGELCLGLDKWPVDVDKTDLLVGNFGVGMLTGMGVRMDGLAAVGLVSGKEIEVGKRKEKIKRYELTDEGKKFYVEREAKSVGLGGVKKIMKGDICYGKKALDKVVKWDGPIKLGNFQGAEVIYLYKINGLAEWANNAAFKTAFPHIAKVIDGAGKEEQKHGVKLTSEGWEANGLNNGF